MIKISDFKKKLDIGQVCRVSDANGLTLILKGTKKGTSYRFEHRCTFNGKRTTYTIPTEDLQQARKIAFERTQNVLDGKDPNGKSASTLTFKQLIDDYIKIHCGQLAPRTLKKFDVINNKYLQPYGDRLVVNFNAKEIYDCIFAPLVPLNQYSTIDYLSSLIRRIYSLATITYPSEQIPNLNGLALILPKSQNNHLPALTDGNITENIQEISMCVQCSSNLKLRLLFKLSMHLLLRQQEVCSIELDNIDYENKLLFIPQTKTLKNGFTVPLTTQVLDIINECKKLKVHSDNKYLLESRVHKFEHINTSTLNAHFKRNGLKGEQTAHGLRAIGRTWLEQQDVKFEVAEACLSHFVGNSTVKAYRRTDYLDERREVMQKWSDYLDTII